MLVGSDVKVDNNGLNKVLEWEKGARKTRDSLDRGGILAEMAFEEDPKDVAEAKKLTAKNVARAVFGWKKDYGIRAITKSRGDKLRKDALEKAKKAIEMLPVYEEKLAAGSTSAEAFEEAKKVREEKLKLAAQQADADPVTEPSAAAADDDGAAAERPQIRIPIKVETGGKRKRRTRKNKKSKKYHKKRSYKKQHKKTHHKRRTHKRR
jgi:hypothetical protein